MNIKKLKLSSRAIALFVPLMLLAACGNSDVVTQDYLTGFNVGQALSIYDTGITGQEACDVVKSSGQYPNIEAVLSSDDGFAGCSAGFEAGVSGTAPNIGDPR